MLLHSVAPFVRAGHTVYSVDYPLAPEQPFPCALVSLLQALAFLHKRYGVSRLVLLGDSAGGNLVTMAAAVVSNPHLLSELTSYSEAKSIASAQFPQISKCISAYGLLDRHSGLTRSGVNGWFCSVGCKFIYECYRSRAVPAPLGNRFTLCDLLDAGEIENFPELFLLAGTADPIYESSVVASASLHKYQLPHVFKSYPSTHGFLGFPRDWFPCSIPQSDNGFPRACVDAIQDVLSFLRSEKVPEITNAKLYDISLISRIYGAFEMNLLTGGSLALCWLFFGRWGVAMLYVWLLVVTLSGASVFVLSHRKLPQHGIYSRNYWKTIYPYLHREWFGAPELQSAANF
ncbi:hypothetical protein CYMTET_29939 [Cymbomonas tetramitiformis]|uniref:Alpha/beta hydrolase fold-3 domain-containing protein n=1 Tax=Cymbomonas tetramitiformis TaxID=36881 RepID=A0AAE0FJT5_9CHLO|nr:hypothetical protein CYMTET_29939 [Cymbomonas tetramitiformis]